MLVLVPVHFVGYEAEIECRDRPERPKNMLKSRFPHPETAWPMSNSNEQIKLIDRGTRPARGLTTNELNFDATVSLEHLAPGSRLPSSTQFCTVQYIVGFCCYHWRSLAPVKKTKPNTSETHGSCYLQSPDIMTR